MLETDEVDDDFFTPMASTTLANIFGNKEASTEGSEDKTLKYTPPKPQIAQKPSDTKQTQCIHACALTAYEWSQNAYVSKGKIGFAIIKQTIGPSHNIVLYDSNKTTLSSTLISTQLQIVVNNNHFSYYDSLQKFWCLYSTEEEIKAIINILKGFDVILNCGDNSKPPSLDKVDNTSKSVNETAEEQTVTQPNSDTDSSINRKTKMSILNRMASMGQSVLPAHSKITEKTSDSTDTEDSKDPPKLVRYKPPKNIPKKILPDKTVDVIQAENSNRHAAVVSNIQKADNSSLYTFVNDILVPVTSTSFIANQGAKDDRNLDLFLTEQRINNSEIRINLNRINDKVDTVVNKISDLSLQQKISSSSTEIELLHKLLKEYESKIKLYEDLLINKNQDITAQSVKQSVEGEKEVNNKEIEIQSLQNKITTQEDTILMKDCEISKLKATLTQLEQQMILNQDNLQKQVNNLESTLTMESSELTNAMKTIDQLSENKTETDITEKVKLIMNETYQTIVENFSNDKMYSGDEIKKVIGTVIRKITVKTLKN